MKKGIILYKSRYGAAKRYAGWLSEETGFSCIETAKARITEVKAYDIIILGGGIYASGIAGLSFLKKHIDVLHGKKILVFCVGASPYEEKAFQEMKSRNMKDNLADIPLFYCRGAWDMEAMNVIDRNLCKMLQKAVAKKASSEYEVWEQALMAAGDKPCDWTDKKYIQPLLNEIKAERT